MQITQIEFFNLDVPFAPHTHEHMQYWLPHWRISQVCKITLDHGIEGWGETITNYTHANVPQDIEQRLLGRNPAALMWQDELGAGVQIALFDAVGKALGVPCYQLLGKKVRDWCPISWWAMDMPPKDWARQCAEAYHQGYRSAKLKARTWFDLHAAIRAIVARVAPQFMLDLDFNGALDNASNAVKFLKTLEAYDQVAMIETPIPQSDVVGNRRIREHIHRPIAMHYGDARDPSPMLFLYHDVVDGFVLTGGASKLLKQAAVCAEANKPFWLQLVGTGITTTWAAHLGAVLSHALWPAITCLNIYESQLVTEPIRVQGGFYRVPEKPGLGIEVDLGALEKYRADYTYIYPPRHIYRYKRETGDVTYYACDRQELRQVYAQDAQPICEPGATLEVVPDDGSETFQRLLAQARGAPQGHKAAGVTDALG